VHTAMNTVDFLIAVRSILSASRPAESFRGLDRSRKYSRSGYSVQWRKEPRWPSMPVRSAWV